MLSQIGLSVTITQTQEVQKVSYGKVVIRANFGSALWHTSVCRVPQWLVCLLDN